ncbi:MAG: diacylglycerol kinase family protein [Patescibacteria group bacterium]|jgi:YegS/Rv2252/BmrU family lipid kinase
MKVLVIYNPVAGKKKEIEKSVKQILADVDYNWLETNKAGDYLDGVDGGQYERVIAVGGDGTVYQVANWILKNNYNLILGIVPRGSANLLANCFKIPGNLGTAISLALSGQPQTIDVGLINKKTYFLIAAGLGYDAWVIKNTERAWKRLFGFWAYTIAMLQGLLSLRENNFSLTIDGVRHQAHAKTIFIMNFGRFLGFDFGPDISYDDGYLSLAVVRPVHFGDYFQMFGRLVGKKFYWQKRLEYYKFKRLQINYDRKVLAQVDGETVDLGSPAEIEVVEKKLKVVKS